MNTEDLFDELADLGVCESGRRLWAQSDRDMAMIAKVWKKWPEYMVEHSKYAAEILRAYFTEEDKAMLAKGQIYFDWKGEVVLENDHAVFFAGECKCKVDLGEWKTVKIYCFNTSEIDMTCGRHSYVNMECYDESKVILSGNPYKGMVYVYDGAEAESHVQERGNVRIEQREFRRGEVFNGEEIADTRYI